MLHSNSFIGTTVSLLKFIINNLKENSKDNVFSNFKKVLIYVATYKPQAAAV